MIPKIIHFCWLSQEVYPLKIQHCINSWEKQLPNYRIMLWDTERFDINLSLWVKQAFNKKKYAFAADYIRFYALYNYGGIYLDSDVEVLKSFDDLLYLPYFVGTEYAGTIEAAVMGAEKNCDWIKSCLDYYENKPFVKSNSSLDIRKLPEIMGEVIRKNKTIINPSDHDISNIKLDDTKENLYIFPNYYFSPKIFDSRKVVIHPETYAIHHYQNSWFSRKALFYYRIRVYLIRFFGYKHIRKFEKILFKR